MAPLIVNKEIFGVVAIIRRNRDTVFSDDDYDRAKIFIEYASITLDSLYSYAQLLEKQEIEREVNKLRVPAFLMNRSSFTGSSGSN